MSGNVLQPKIFAILMTGLALFSAITKSAEKQAEYHFSHENILGTSLDLRIQAESLEEARTAESRILASIERQSKIYSTYDSASELSRLQMKPIGEPVRSSTELRRLVRLSQKWNEQTAGAFDVRVERLSQLWTKAAKLGQLPAEAEIQALVENNRKSCWLIDDSAKTIMRTGDAPITFNAIATGTIIDQACLEVLSGNGAVSGVMIDIGGDIRVAGDMDTLIGVAHPQGTSENAAPLARLRLKNAAVTTSGDLYKGFVIGGQKFSHIIDPATGRPVESVTSATVVAPTAEQADALATAFNVMPPEKSLALAESIEGVACLLVTADGRLLVSKHWANFTYGTGGLGNLMAMAMTGLALPQKSGGKSDLLPLEVQFEINQPDESRRYRRPYVAVWVEDAEGFSVRTLALWLQAGGARWHPDLRRWYRDDQARKLVDDTNLIATMAKPTKAPGKYTVSWDGLDDAGLPVKPGTYTILIEAAREHGTYQLIRQELTLGEKAMDKNLAGNVEIKSARIVYGGSAAK